MRLLEFWAFPSFTRPGTATTSCSDSGVRQCLLLIYILGPVLIGSCVWALLHGWGTGGGDVDLSALRHGELKISSRHRLVRRLQRRKIDSVTGLEILRPVGQERSIADLPQTLATICLSAVDAVRMDLGSLDNVFGLDPAVNSNARRHLVTHLRENNVRDETLSQRPWLLHYLATLVFTPTDAELEARALLSSWE